MLAERLVQYTGCGRERCQTALDTHANDFWLALFDLCQSEQSKPVLLQQLETATEDKKVLEHLKMLRNFYFNLRYFNALSEILHDEDLMAVIDKPKPITVEAEPGECDYYLPALTSENQEIIYTALAILGSIPSTPFSPALIAQLRMLMRHEDWNLANHAIRITMDRPERIDLFQADIAYNLGLERDMNHYTAVRAFWSKQSRIYPAIVPAIETLAETTGESQVRSMALDILDRYQVRSPAELTAMAETAAAGRREAIHAEVNAYQTPEDLFAFAAAFNWDNDVEYLRAVAMHPQCDRATAKLIYWRSRPTFDLAFASVDEVPAFRKPVFDLQQLIERRMAANEYPAGAIEWDPHDDGGYDWTPDRDPDTDDPAPISTRTIPEWMY